jgi:hypothetical protein
MPIYGVDLNRCNPEYTIQDFTMFMPQFTKFMATDQGLLYFNNLYPMANNKIFYSIFGTDWKYAMSLCIAHYLYLIAKNAQGTAGDTLESIATGQSMTGVLTGVSVGGFSKSYDFQYTVLNNAESSFWNQSSFGSQLMSLYATKYVPSIFVVNKNTSPLPPTGCDDGNPYNYLLNDNMNSTGCNCAHGNEPENKKHSHRCFEGNRH